MDKLANHIPAIGSIKPHVDLLPEQDNERNEASDHYRAIVGALFVKFRALYPTTFERAFRDEQTQRIAMEEWARGLEGIHATKISRAMRLLDGDFPPSLPRFRALCKSGDATTPNTFRRLEQLPADTATANKGLQAARSALRRGNPSDPGGETPEIAS